MPELNTYRRTCTICGAGFQTRCTNAKYCDKCRPEVIKINQREKYEKARRMGLHKSDGQKKVAQFDKNGMLRCVFSSATEASKKTGIARCNISAVARGNTRAKTAGGYIWRYI